jgi:hypothetical protein
MSAGRIVSSGRRGKLASNPSASNLKEYPMTDIVDQYCRLVDEGAAVDAQGFSTFANA